MDGLKVVLTGPRNPLNIGAAARAMSNFGFCDLCLVNPYEVAFREARSAVGAEAILEQAREYPTLADALSGCSLVVGTTAGEHRELRQPYYRLELGARLIRRHQGAAALLFGSENTVFPTTTSATAISSWESPRGPNTGPSISARLSPSASTN